MPAASQPPPEPFNPKTTERPDPLLLKHYTIVCALTGPLFLLIWPPHYFKYKTLRYRFDDDGVWMAWGLLFKREINLAYRRIQDINVTRGLIQRWLGLASVAIQTASGSSSAEMTIEGILDPDGLRDYLYSKTRGAKGLTDRDDQPEPADDDTLVILTDIRDGIQQLRARVDALEASQDNPDAP